MERKYYQVAGYIVLILALIAHLMDYISYYFFMQIFVLILVYAGWRLYINVTEDTNDIEYWRKEKISFSLIGMLGIIIVLSIPSYHNYKNAKTLQTTCESIIELSYKQEMHDDKNFKRVENICSEVVSYDDKYDYEQ